MDKFLSRPILKNICAPLLLHFEPIETSMIKPFDKIINVAICNKNTIIDDCNGTEPM